METNLCDVCSTRPQSQPRRRCIHMAHVRDAWALMLVCAGQVETAGRQCASRRMRQDSFPVLFIAYHMGVTPALPRGFRPEADPTPEDGKSALLDITIVTQPVESSSLNAQVRGRPDGFAARAKRQQGKQTWASSTAICSQHLVPHPVPRYTLSSDRHPVAVQYRRHPSPSFATAVHKSSPAIVPSR